MIVDNNVKVYQFKSFQTDIQTINDNFKDVPIIVASNQTKNFIVAYERTLSDGSVLSFSPIKDELPVIMMDNGGTKWNIFGEAVAGPRVGSRLTATKSFIAYWFAWATFYPGLEMHS